jgi:hypothetical protein
MTDSDRRDPYSSFNFRVIVDGVSIGEFSEVTGPTAEGDAIDYLKAANSQPTVRKLVGLRKIRKYHAQAWLRAGPVIVELVPQGPK